MVINYSCNAKGGEEDNVILSLHQGSKVQKSITSKC